MSRIRSYSELLQIQDFEERYRYLRLGGAVGEVTFGGERYLNQQFYSSYEWRDIRHFVRARDLACDLAWPAFPLHTTPFVHHINPLTPEQILDRDPCVLDPENLITVSHRTHNAIHYGDESQLPRELVVRRPGDTKLW